ncbi:MAG: hypothetical protein AB7L09_02020 [Nitrospira sp.]
MESPDLVNVMPDYSGSYTQEQMAQWMAELDEIARDPAFQVHIFTAEMLMDDQTPA